MKVSSPGERQTLLGCKSRGSTDPLVPEIQSCYCCSRGPGDPTVQSNKGTRSLATSRSHMGHICSLQSLPKAQGFHDFLRTARLCTEVWCYWIHVGVYNTVETFQHSKICCLLLAEMRNWHKAMWPEYVHSYVLFTLLELLM